MNTQDFTYLLQHPESLNSSHTKELDTIISSFPYFQSARALHLKGLKNEESFKYNQSLKTTAAHTTDRSILFEFITSSVFTQKENQLNESEIEVIASESVTEEIEEQHTISNEPSDILEIGKPLSFNRHESHSFNEWLQLGTTKPIKREEVEESTKQASQFDIIEKFIATNPKINPVKKEESKSTDLKQIKTDYNSLMTETLAKVYVEQKKYENAIKAYRILSLKYPEKSGFFADRIKAIENLGKK